MKKALFETAREGLLNLTVELGMETLRQMLEVDVTELVGEKGKHDNQRAAYRHGTENTKVVLGGEKRSVRKPRARGKSGVELSLPALAIFQDEESLSRACAVGTVGWGKHSEYACAKGFDGTEVACTSKSEVSRKFVKGLSALINEFFQRRIEGE
jgi:hypothetical protein